MDFYKKILLGTSGLCAISVVNYIIFFNSQSYLDEAVLTLFIGTIAATFLLVIKPNVGKLNALFEKLKAHQKGDSKIENPVEALEQVLQDYSSMVDRATNFINDIKSGNLETVVNVDGENELTTALISLRDQMISIAQEEKERNWVNEGMARFVEILRGDNGSSKSFYDSLITNIVKYMNASQGGLFLVENEGNDQYLSLASCYAFERKKFLEKKLAVGEGLVGQAFLERDTIFMKQIPDQYVKIRSGLGDAPPKYLLIVPFKINEEVECIVELASFNEFELYQIEFLEKLGESIASTVANLKINENTKKLLEETQENTELLKSQEEELRQSMEELEATQEEMRRKEAEMVNVLEQLNGNEVILKENLNEIERMKERDEEKIKLMIQTMEEQKKTLIEIINKLPQKIFLKDAEGKFIIANQAVADAHHLSIDELIGKSDFDFFDSEMATEYRNAEIEMINAGVPVYFPEEVFKDSNGEDKILQTTKMPFYIGYLNQTGLLGIQTDITEAKKTEKYKSDKGQ